MEITNIAKAYFATQGIGVLLWWILVFYSPAVRTSTLGDLPVTIAWLDIPLLAFGSFFAVVGIRLAAWVVLVWTIFVTLFMVIYATITREAAWGMLIMVLASLGTIGASFIVLLGHIPTEMLVSGPFAFQSTNESSGHLQRTILQLIFFWTTFLVIIPLAIIYLEDRWHLAVSFPFPSRVLGLITFALASSLGVWSATTMADRGKGTPLPSSMARFLVTSGPYSYVRNPMAVAGIAQGASVGLIASSWLVVLYALTGSLLWNWAVRPHEEADLQVRFGAEYDEYKRNVDCWVPRSILQKPFQAEISKIV